VNRSTPREDELVERLLAASDGELREVLRQVFERRMPYPEEAAYHRSRFFLGVVSSELESEPEAPERWGAYQLRAVAYADRDTYGDDPGPDGWAQRGTCEACGTSVCSNLRQGVCPVCGAAVRMS
jgi:hypothetical protein